jgi:hypothetical protein
MDEDIDKDKKYENPLKKQIWIIKSNQQNR